MNANGVDILLARYSSNFYRINSGRKIPIFIFFKRAALEGKLYKNAKIFKSVLSTYKDKEMGKCTDIAR